MLILVAYDIPDDRRRLDVADALADFGFRVQFSVFEAVLDEVAYRELVLRLERLVDVKSDKVRVYCICRNCEAKVTIMGSGAVTTEPEVLIV